MAEQCMGAVVFTSENKFTRGLCKMQILQIASQNPGWDLWSVLSLSSTWAWFGAQVD